jgi:alkylation response protein AidB-like acyl-CoA dehydrogenase
MQTVPERLELSRDSSDDDIVVAVDGWVTDHVPEAWRAAAANGGRAAIREVRSRESYEDWYPVFAGSGLVVATWPVAYGGLDLTRRQARIAEELLAPYNLGRLNPLGLNVTAPARTWHHSPPARCSTATSGS